MNVRVRVLVNGVVGLLLAGLAAGGAAPAYGQKPKARQWAYAFDLSCRKFGEQEFTKDTKTYSLEVFRDGNTGNWLYVTEAGKLASAAGKKDFAAPPSLKAPQWLHSMDLRSRKAGVKEWTKETPAYGIEVYRDN